MKTHNKYYTYGELYEMKKQVSESAKKILESKSKDTEIKNMVTHNFIQQGIDLDEEMNSIVDYNLLTPEEKKDIDKQIDILKKNIRKTSEGVFILGKKLTK